VPARALSWQRVHLPPGLALGSGQQTPRLRSALDGLLEDRVLDDAAQLHFALQPGAQAGEPLWVAVCDRAWLRENLQALEAAGRRVARVVPEFSPGPTASGRPELCVLGTPEDACVVLTGQGADHGVAVLPLSIASVMLARPGLAQSAGNDDDDDAPVVRAEPAVAALAERTLGQRVALHTASQRALDAARSDWDLAQFDLASTGRTRALRRAGSLASALLYAPQWRAARWGAGVLVAAHLIGLNAWAWQERQSLAAKQAAVRATLTQTFPKVQVVVDAPVQMDRELAQLRQAAGSVSTRDLEPLLAAAGRALPPGRQPTGIEYSPGELRLRGVALPPDEETGFTARLEPLGYRARVDDGSLVLQQASAGGSQ
ncbi:MAG: general secretion pathway protein GspL, partial [Comamonadaceae bacterium]